MSPAVVESPVPYYSEGGPDARGHPEEIRGRVSLGNWGETYGGHYLVAGVAC